MGLPLHLSDLSVTSDRGRQLLRLPELTVASGEAVGIRGPSGAGKSTLLYALAGLFDTVGGTAHWGDTEILQARPSRRAAFRRQHIGMIFQDFLLFEELSAEANAALGALFAERSGRAGLRSRARHELNRLGLTDTDRGVASFSGGERQRVAVARALASDPDVLLADEPTASLHREAADALITDLCTMARAEGRTLIAVSHDARLLDQMDRVLTVRDGTLEALA